MTASLKLNGTTIISESGGTATVSNITSLSHSSGSNIFDSNGLVKVSNIANFDGSSSSRAAKSSIDIKMYNPDATTGWYWLDVNGTAAQFWIDMDYDGGGWILVATHPINVSIPNNITFVNGATSSNVMTGSTGFVRGTSDPREYSTWVSLETWLHLTQQRGVKDFVYHTRSAAGGPSSSDSRRSRWRWTGWGTNYDWVGEQNLVNEIGGTTPGLWSYHIANGYNFTTYDDDNDASGGNCATSYGNAPFWYGSCWDGNFWGGNGGSGHANAPFWTGSGSDYYNYGAYYIK